MRDQLDDRRLVKALMAHDSRAFDEFFDGYFPRLYRFARARLAEDSDAVDDIVQVTLSKAVRKLHTYRGEASLFTWLCTICRNEISDHLRWRIRERRRVVLSEDFPEVRAAVESLSAPPGDEPEENFSRLEVRRLIQVALDQLPTHYGNALEWKYIYGFSSEEIAQRLELSLEATNSVLARARRAFHSVYAEMVKGIGSAVAGAANGEPS